MNSRFTRLALARWTVLAALAVVSLTRFASANVYTWLALERGTPSPANLQLGGNAVRDPANETAFALRLVEAGVANVDGSAVISAPNSDVASRRFKYFTASFHFMAILGNGGEGFSFNYGPDSSDYYDGLEDLGTTQGLSVYFKLNPGAGANDEVGVVYDNGAWAINGSTSLWDPTFSSRHGTAEISYGPGGLVVNVYMRQWFNGPITATYNLINGQLPGWEPQPGWKFFFGARNSSNTSRITLTSVTLRTDSEPPVISGLPASFTFNEDGAAVADFFVSDFEDPLDVQISRSAPATGPIQTSGIGINILGGGFYHLTLIPTPNATGTTTISIHATQDGDTTTVNIPVTVNPINDAPTVTISNQTSPEDVPINTSFSVNDVDSTITSVTTTVSWTNPTLFPAGSIQIQGNSSTRNLIATPAPHQSGTSTVTIAASDGVGGNSTQVFTITIQPANDLPVAGSPFALALDGVNDYALAASSGLGSGNASHTIETWAQISAVVGRAWLLHVGGSGNGHHWLLNPVSSAEARVQFGAWSVSSLQLQDFRIPLGKWVHLATTYDADTKLLILYIDGAEVGRTTGAGAAEFNLQAGLTLGRPISGGGTESFLKGALDEVRLWNRALSAAEIQQNFIRPLTGTESGLVQYLRFDEGQNVAAYNTSRNAGAGSAATLFDGATRQLRHNDYGVRFVGGTDAVTIPHDASFNAYPFTVSAWFRSPPGGSGNGGIVNKYDNNGTSKGFAVYLLAGNVLASFTKDASSSIAAIAGGSSLNDNQWHHVAYTVDNAGGRLYIDGTLRGTAPWTGTPGAASNLSPIAVGQLTLGLNTFVLPGTVADVGFWNQPLTDTQILSAAYSQPKSEQSGLVAFWPLDGTSAPAVTDITANPVNGSLAGNAAFVAFNPALAFGRQIVPEDNTSLIFLPSLDIEFERGETGTFTFSIIDPPSHGTVATTSGSLVVSAQNPISYTPIADYAGPDSFRYRVTDASGATSEATLHIEVSGDNDLPVISSIANIIIEESTSSDPIPFLISDADHDFDELSIRVTSDAPALIPNSEDNLVLGGINGSRHLVITPIPNEIGTAEITITVTDPLFGSVQERFKVRVDPKPAYALIDVGALPGARSFSFASGVNDQGWVVGYSQTLNSPEDDSAAANRRTESRAFLRRGVSSDSIEDLGTLSFDVASRSRALGINNDNLITGFATSSGSGLREVFTWSGGSMTSVASLIQGGNDSIGLGVNAAGDVAGSFRISGTNRRAFRILGGTTFLNLGVLPGGTSSEAFALNAASTTVGYSVLADGREHAFRYQTAIEDIGTLPDHHSSRAYSINDDGLIVGWSRTNAQPSSPRLAFLYQPTANPPMRSLGLLANGNFSEAYSINAFGQVVGDADRRLDNGTTESRAFLFSAGQIRDLNDLIHDSRDFVFGESTWKLTSARAINRGGAIAGTGLKDGRPRAYLAIPAWVIGRQIARPEGTVARRPEIEIISGNPGDTRENAFFWSEFEKRLYPIRPVTAIIRWFTSETDISGEGVNIVVNTDRVVIEGVSVWPQQPLIHVATAPVQVEPQGVPFDFGFQSIIHETTGGSARYDATSKIFNSTNPGYSVLYYLETDGANPNPQLQRPRFEVARTYAWDKAPTLEENTPAVIGTPLSHPSHEEYLGRTGHLLFPNAFYDGVGPDRAHDRPSRRGPIIPVNREPSGDTTSENDLIVVWYRLSPIGVAWPSTPVRYSVDWPANEDIDKIVIASGEGSGSLPSNEFPNKRIYIQSDPALPGYNPNEEHALLLNDVLYALRNDLNAVVSPEPSLPYALLKYKDNAKNEWRIKPFKVVAEDSTHTFNYTRVAGTEIVPPAPLFSLPLVPESHGVSGPWWEDFQGRLYARAAGPSGTSSSVVIRWFYPLQPEFFYDLDGDGTQDEPVGASIPWLDRRSANALTGANASVGLEGVPIQVTYNVTWPRVGTLQIGQTLLNAMDTSTGKLPGIRNMANLQFIHDDLSPDWNPLQTDTPPVLTLARLYDPLSTRTYLLATDESIPSVVRRSNRNGKEYFDDLPPTLIDRLAYDPIQKALLFSGVLDEKTYVGQPLLLPNVLSSRERDAIRHLVPASHASRSDWESVVENLYDLTRNPNQVDVLPKDGIPDRASDTDTNVPPAIYAQAGLRLGLETVYSASSTSGPPVTLRNLAGLPEGYTVTGTNVVTEALGSTPKALTAALGGVPAAPFQPGSALSFPGLANSFVTFPDVEFGSGEAMTFEAWVHPSTLSGIRTVVRQGNTNPDWSIEFLNGGSQLAFTLNAGGSSSILTSPINPSEFENQWNHIAATYDGAVMRLLVNGVQIASQPKTGFIATAHTTTHLGVTLNPSSVLENPFAGAMDEIRFWGTALPAFVLGRDSAKNLFGDEDFLVRYYQADDSGSSLKDASGGAQNGTLAGTTTFVASDAPTGVRPRYLTLVENNDPALGALPVQLHIIRVDDGPFIGDMKALYPGNVFDQRLTLRHSSDFGGDPDPAQFEWYYQPDTAGFDPTSMPVTDASGNVTDANGWIPYTAAARDLAAPAPPVLTDARQGVNDITLGQGSESSLLTLGDTWFICRYRGYNVRGKQTWSDWIGDPSGGATPRAMLAEGWIKRVIRGLNPFDARVKDFHSSPSATYVSLILQAGARYEGDIAFNPSAENLNSIGLIEAYSTVLNRGRKLSIDQGHNFDPANNALLLAASRISDLYMLLGNEALADAADPTIGFTTTDGAYSAQATSIFAFQNQLDSLIEEELALLRGRDDSLAGVAAQPVYNRLLWNFTLGDGEIAYQRVYNIGDQSKDGFIDERDARLLYPQGHGDAWGHYLTAIKSYYTLLQHPNFTWVPRSESVLVAGQPVTVDFYDERKFAQAASARAKAGHEIVDLTYRANYVEDPAGQWQGYKDTKTERAWGVDEWARRAGQGAYFDWLTANAILPVTDPDPTHVGVQKIDRSTVLDIDDIRSQFQDIQTVMDAADGGLNPVGLAKGAIVFDIDPTFLAVGSTAAIGRQAVQGLAHFEQLNERAIKMLKNAVRIWDEANKTTESLRENQDEVDEFTRNVDDTERDYKNRLIEIFGYPHAGNIGPGKVYPSGYDGPDLYYYNYVPVPEVTGTTAVPSEDFIEAVFKPMKDGGEFRYTFTADAPPGDPAVLETEILPLLYPISVSSAEWAFSEPSSWGRRRAPGELQEALSEFIQANTRLKGALQNYCGLVLDIQDQIGLLNAQAGLNSRVLSIREGQLGTVIGMNSALAVMSSVETHLRRVAGISREVTEAAKDGLPKVAGLAFDIAAFPRAVMAIATVGSVIGLETVADGLAVAQTAVELSKEVAELSFDLQVDTAERNFEVLQRVAEIKHMVRDEYNLRLDAFNEAEVVRQALGKYLSKLAEGERLIQERLVFRQRTAATATELRYRDAAFRIFRNEAIQKYRATFDMAARYVYLSATAYDYESNFLGTDQRAGRNFLTQIIRQRNLGVLSDGEPIPGQAGLADIQGRMLQNWEVLEPQFGLNNPQLETANLSLRNEFFRMKDDDEEALDDGSDLRWRAALNDPSVRVKDLWQVPEFRRFCRPFATERSGPQPGLVLRMPTTITFGQNFFGWPLSGGDTAFDPSHYSTKINYAGITFRGYDESGLAAAPRVYLFPVGMDTLRSPTGNDLATREWRVLDQALPQPFAIGANDLGNPGWIPQNNLFGEPFTQIRRFAGIRAYPSNIDPVTGEEFDESSIVTSSRLVGRSVWNTQWVLIIPGGTLLDNAEAGLDRFIQSVSDIRIILAVYSFPGN